MCVNSARKFAMDRNLYSGIGDGDIGTTLWWYCGDIMLILARYYGDIGTILWWYYGDIGTMLWWYYGYIGTIVYGDILLLLIGYCIISDVQLFTSYILVYIRDISIYTYIYA